MKVIILGAGAIGSFYGARLSKLNDVILIGRRKHVNYINKNGLRVTGLENTIYKLRAATKVGRIKDETLILLTTKVYDSKKAVSSIKNLIKKDVIILCMQNGLYSENISKDIVGKECKVLRGITDFGAAFLEPGIVQLNNYGHTFIEKSPTSKEIAEELNKCGLNCYISKDIKIDMWKKIILNCVLNPLTAILRVENNVIADEKLNPIKKLIVDECLEVAKKDGAKFNFDFVKAINDGIENSRNISSMLQDLLKGNPTEIDYLNGAVVELGEKYGVKCPVNEALVMIIKEMEKLNK